MTMRQAGNGNGLVVAGWLALTLLAGDEPANARCAAAGMPHPPAKAAAGSTASWSTPPLALAIAPEACGVRFRRGGFRPWAGEAFERPGSGGRWKPALGSALGMHACGGAPRPMAEPGDQGAEPRRPCSHETPATAWPSITICKAQ